MSSESSNEPEPTEKESQMTEAIARDRPTIDAAAKSFISMVCARSMSASATDATSHDKVMMGIIPSLQMSSISEEKPTSNKSSDEKAKNSPSVQQQVLEVARCILKSVNSYTFPVQDTVAYSMAEKPGTSDQKKEELLELSVVARLWNGLVQSEQKPSRFLGKRALKLAWKKMNVEAALKASDDETILERQTEWLQQFETLLFASIQPLPSDVQSDDDAALLWAPDGGAAELAKRRQRRLDAAKERGPVTPL